MDVRLRCGRGGARRTAGEVRHRPGPERRVHPGRAGLRRGRRLLHGRGAGEDRMSNVVEVPFGDNPSETATLLLAAAEELGRDASEVRTSAGVFLVPEEIVQQVGAERPEETR